MLTRIHSHVFDLVNIIPWLKTHNNVNPVTKQPLDPSELISLNYTRKEGTGEIVDPVSFKPFSENSHIVAISTTGNVYLAESVLKGGKDLLTDTDFKKCLAASPSAFHLCPPQVRRNHAAESSRPASSIKYTCPSTVLHDDKEAYKRKSYAS